MTNLGNPVGLVKSINAGECFVAQGFPRNGVGHGDPEQLLENNRVRKSTGCEAILFGFIHRATIAGSCRESIA